MKLMVLRVYYHIICFEKTGSASLEVQKCK